MTDPARLRPLPSGCLLVLANEEPRRDQRAGRREVCPNSPAVLPARSPRLALTLEGRSMPPSGSLFQGVSPGFPGEQERLLLLSALGSGTRPCVPLPFTSL